MKIKLFTFLLFLSFTINSKAESCELSVIAKSGLHLRSEASQNSKILKKFNFGEIIFSPGTCEHIAQLEKDNLIEIEGIHGFWIPVYQNEIEGYVFSGYLMFGNVFKNSNDKSIDNIILDEKFYYGDEGILKYEYLNYEQYSPHLKWHTIVMKKDSFSIQSAKIDLVNLNNRWKSDEIYVPNVALEIDSTLKFDFLIGTQKALKPGTYPSTLYEQCDGTFGKFLFPEEKIEIIHNHSKYIFKAFERIEINQENANKMERRYDIALNIPYRDLKIQLPKNLFILNLIFEAKFHAGYKSPKLFWSGDINQDGILDFFFDVSAMADKCGAYNFLRFLYSNKNENEIKYKANENYIEYDNFPVPNRR